MNKLRKFLALPMADQWLLARCVVLVALIRLGLNTLTLAAVQQRLKPWMSPDGRRQQRTNEIPSAEMDRLMWAIRQASRCVPAATCLTQALAAQVMLGREGCPTQLRLGVTREAGEFQAHAWVECGGRVIIGDHGSLAKFTTLPAID
jgi:hypothetical protein